MGKYVVEDHGNGFMVIGTNKPRKARKVLKAYVDKIKRYRFACPTHYDGRSAVWLSVGPADHWDGALDHVGRPLPR
jgi:hypothetical protein